MEVGPPSRTDFNKNISSEVCEEYGHRTDNGGLTTAPCRPSQEDKRRRSEGIADEGAANLFEGKIDCCPRRRNGVESSNVTRLMEDSK